MHRLCANTTSFCQGIGRTESDPVTYPECDIQSWLIATSVSEAQPILLPHRVAWTTSSPSWQANFCTFFLVDTGFHHVTQATHLYQGHEQLCILVSCGWVLLETSLPGYHKTTGLHLFYSSNISLIGYTFCLLFHQ